MLVISRRLREKIWIGNVCVQIVDIDRGKIRLGIEAEKSIKIAREELLAPAEAEQRMQAIREANSRTTEGRSNAAES